jgi:hypothetical protein
MLSAALLALAATSPAAAQFDNRIPPQHIEAMVRSMGYQPVADPRPRGPLWVTHAVDRDGQHVRVLIDSYSGRVIDVLRRPVPPQNVSLNPPANIPFPPQGDARFPQQFPPQANVPQSDYQEGPDYDYRDMPHNRRPADWPPSRPNVQQQGPSVIPLDPRSDNTRVSNPPKTNTAKKKEKKNDATAAVTPEKDKQTPSPKARPADAPKPDAQKSDAQKNAQMPKMPAADTQRGPDPQTTGTIKEVPTFGAPKNDTLKALPPVQPPF